MNTLTRWTYQPLGEQGTVTLPAEDAEELQRRLDRIASRVEAFIPWETVKRDLQLQSKDGDE